MEMMDITLQSVLEEYGLYESISKDYDVIKRITDITLSLIGIILILPLMIITAIAIKLESKGPVFFAQERVGQSGRVFRMYKFRSMVKDAEHLLEDLKNRNEVSGPMFKIRNDPRITRVGRFIRKTSIDELPQLINVLRGEMSLVGPRPPLLREVEEYESWHNLRLSVKPGLTGLWQTSARNDVGFDEMIKLDLEYIRERGFWYDMKLIMKTIPVILGDSKAF